MWWLWSEGILGGFVLEEKWKQQLSSGELRRGGNHPTYAWGYYQVMYGLFTKPPMRRNVLTTMTA